MGRGSDRRREDREFDRRMRRYDRGRGGGDYMSEEEANEQLLLILIGIAAGLGAIVYIASKLDEHFGWNLKGWLTSTFNLGSALIADPTPLLMLFS